MLVLGGHGVFGTMIAEAAEAAGWTASRSSRRPSAGFCHVDLAEPQTLEKVIDEADVIVSTVPDEQLVAERMVLDRGDLLARHPEADEVELVFTISVKGSVGPAGGHPDWLTATKRHRTTVVRLPEPFGRRRCPPACWCPRRC